MEILTEFRNTINFIKITKKNVTLKELIIPASQGCKCDVVFGGKKCNVIFVKLLSSFIMCTGALSTNKRILQFCDRICAFNFLRNSFHTETCIHTVLFQ